MVLFIGKPYNNRAPAQPPGLPFFRARDEEAPRIAESEMSNTQHPLPRIRTGGDTTPVVTFGARIAIAPDPAAAHEVMP